MTNTNAGPLNPPPLAPAVSGVLANAQALNLWIAEHQNELATKTDDRTRVVGALLDLAIEHHVAIVTLIDQRVFGSAFALLRCELEVYVRALWLNHCASDEELSAFVEQDKLELKFFQMVDAIERLPDFGDKVLSGVRQAAWKPMNSYTHGGMHQVCRRMKPDTYEPNYDDDEIIEVLQASGTFALWSLMAIAKLAGATSLGVEVKARLMSPPSA